MGVLALLGLLIFIFLAIILSSIRFDQYQKYQLNRKEVIKDINEKKSVSDIVVGVAAILLVASLILAVNYFVLVKLNLRYTGVFFLILIFIILAVNISKNYFHLSIKGLSRISGIAALVFILIVAFYAVFGGRTYFHAEAYSNLIEITETQFTSDVQTVDVTTLPIVDKAYGEKLGSLKLGEYPGIGSEFEAGDYSDIIFNGEQYMVAPLEYRGLFKWLSNNSIGTPGYIKINKVTGATELVNLRETEGYGLLYTPSAYLEQDLTRHAYYNGLASYQLESTYFEIDEAGHPYYVMSYSLPTIFINGGRDIVKVAVIDAVLGTVDVYDPLEVPDWVESVYPSSLVLEQLSYWGSLQDGWFNSFLAQKGVLQPSYGKRTIMNDGELYYFTGLTSAGSDESTIGFVYMSTKTKETKLYRFPGATEDAAMNKTLTLLPQNNISTSFPIPINVLDTPTYFILIKGEDGRILRHVFMSVQDLEVYGMSETKTNAYNAYLLALGDTNSDNLDLVEGTITALTSYVSEGNTIYWIELDSDEIYLINVSSFDLDEMRYFISKDIGDDISFNVQGYTVMTFNME